MCPLRDTVLEPLRWAWRRLPPRDARLLLQRLETEADRQRLFDSPHYAPLLACEAEFWAAQAARPKSKRAGSASGSAPTGSMGSAASSPAFASAPNWQAHPVVLRHFQHQADPQGRDPWRWLETTQRGGVERALVLGAGEGDHCRILIDRGIARHVEAVDAAQPLVERANAAFAREGYPIEYRVGDLNRLELARGRYGLVLANHVLHHVVALERLFETVAGALEPDGGRLVMEEYVGPRHLELPTAVRRQARDFLRQIPEPLRIDRVTRLPLRRLGFESRWCVMKRTPFEAVRSDRIVELLRERFAVEIERPLGGGLLMALLPAIIHNFDPDNRQACRWLRRIARADHGLTATGAIPNCFVFAAARKR